MPFLIPPKEDDPQRLIQLNGVPQKFWLSALEINLIIKHLAALLGEETALYKGEYNSIEHLEAEHPLPEPGSEAQIIVVDGDNLKASWDNTNKKWFLDGIYTAPGSSAAYLLKSVYDANGDGIIDKAKDLQDVLAAGGTKYYGTRNGVVGVFDFPGFTGGTGAPKLTQWTTGWQSGLTFKPYAEWSHDGNVYDDTRIITLDAAHSTYDRFDLLAVDLSTKQIIVKKGTASANPVKPEIDPETELEGVFISVKAGASAPDGISKTIIYAENAGSAGGEWDASQYIGPSYNLASTTSPRTGTYAIESTQPLPASQTAYFDAPAAIPINEISEVEAWIKYKGIPPASPNMQILVRGTDKNGKLAIEYLPGPGLTDSNSYQRLSAVIPPNTRLAQVERIGIRAGNDQVEFFIDDFSYTNGIEPAPVGDFATVEFVLAEDQKTLQAAKDHAAETYEPKLPEGDGTEKTLVIKPDGTKAWDGVKYTQQEKDKLSGLDGPHFKGTYTNLSALNTAHPTAAPGDYADVDAGAGANAKRYIWDQQEGWVPSTGEIAGETAESIATKYHSNEGIEAFTTTLKNKLDSITAIFTTALKNSYDTAASWVSTNGQNVLDHLTKWATPTTAGKMPRTKADGSIEWVDEPTGGSGGGSVITVASSRALAATDIGNKLLVTAAVTLTWPSGGIAGFECNFDIDAGGQLTIAEGTAGEVDAPDGKILEAGKMAHAYRRPDTGKLRLIGTWTA